MTLIYLIRHGDNELLGKRMPGWLPDVHLNDQGRAQAEALADLLSEVKFKAIFSSPLERAVETAAPLADRLGIEIITRPGLGELDVGSWEGRTFKQLRRRKLWPLVHRVPSLVQFPEGETFRGGQARIAAELECIRGEYNGKDDHIACFSHSDMIRLAIAYYLGLPLDLFHRLHVSPASISILALQDDSIHVLKVNDSRAAEGAHPE
jgi:probable phosphomutase (TIGR03848 family)